MRCVTWVQKPKEMEMKNYKRCFQVAFQAMRHEGSCELKTVTIHHCTLIISRYLHAIKRNSCEGTCLITVILERYDIDFKYYRSPHCDKSF